MACKFVAYYRVSRESQGKSGLGLEAQRKSVEDYAEKANCDLIREFEEVESGRNADRPKLLEAIKYAKKTGATLLIAKLDRLSRNLPFLYRLRDENVKFIAADMPAATDFMIGVMVLFAEQEAKMISQRTKDALAAAKRRGVKLGGPLGQKAFGRSYIHGSATGVKVVKAQANGHAHELAEDVAAIQAEGITTLQGIAEALNGKGFLTRRGGQWHPTSVKRLIDRLPA